MEQNAALQGGERDNRLQGRIAFTQRIKRFLFKFDQRKVGRCKDFGRSSAGPDQRAQILRQQNLEMLHLSIFKESARPAQTPFESVVGHNGVDVPENCLLPEGIGVRPVFLVRHAPEGAFLQCGKTSQVVEGEGRAAGQFRMAALAQKTIAYPVPRQGTQAFLDLQHRFTRRFG